MEWSAVKSGWLFERKGWWNLGRKWAPRYVVLYDEPVPALGIYEQRSDASPPYAPLRHLDLLPDTQALAAGDKRDHHQPPIEADEQATIRSSRRPSVFGGWMRRKSYQSLASESPEADEQKIFYIFRASGGGKLCFATKNAAERDEWLAAIHAVLCKGAPAGTETSAGVAESAALLPGSVGARRISHQQPDGSAALLADAQDRRHDAETISWAGITIMEGRVVARIRATTGSTVCNPLIIRGAAAPVDTPGSSASSADSILGPPSQSLAVINSADPYDDLDALSLKYQKTMLDRSKADHPRDILRLELQVQRLIGKFHGHVGKTLRRIVDDYHRAGGKLGGGTKFEEGPLRIMFIADYAQASEEVVAGAYAWLRQELNAARWITKGRGALQQPLMTVAEYKGFRVLAMMALPLSERTVALEAQAGIFEEALVEECQRMGKRLNLAPYPYRMPDGRMVTLALPASIEVHHLERRRNREHDRSKPQLHIADKEKPGHPGAPTAAAVAAPSSPFTATTPPGYYVTSVHDLMPPYPSKSDADSRGGQLCFRAELIQALPVPYAAGDLIAIKSLRDQRLPDFLAKLESLEILPLDSEAWRTEMHRAGLNMALLGAVARETSLPHIREAVTIEMIARTTKLILRSRLRGSILHFRDVQALRVEEELTATVVEALNGILCMDPQWTEEVLATAEDHFGYRIEMERVRHLPRNALLMALQHHCSLQLAESAYTRTAPGDIEPADLLGFACIFTDGGNGCFAPSAASGGNIPAEEALLINLAHLLLPLGEALWSMDGKRAAAAKTALQLAEAACSGPDCRWERAAKFAELAAGLCPKQHPFQVMINLFLAQARMRAPAHLNIRAPLSLPASGPLVSVGSGGGHHHGSGGNLLSRPSGIVGEKGPNRMGSPPPPPPPSMAAAMMREGGEDLKRLRTCLLNRLQRHFGPHHPLGIEVRERLADLFELCKSMASTAAKEHSLALRQEALGIAQKVLGRRHERVSHLMVSLARAHARFENYDDASAAFEEAIQSLPESSGQLAGLMAALAECRESKGDIEGALEWAQRALGALESVDAGSGSIPTQDGHPADPAQPHQGRRATTATLHHGAGPLWEAILGRIANLSQKIFASATGGDDTAAPATDRTETSPLKELLSCAEDMLPEAIALHLQRALGCYERLFDARRKRDLETVDGQALLELARKIIMLTMRLASPSQRPVLRAAVRRKLFARPGPLARASDDREAEVRELLVQMVTGPVSPREMVERVLVRAQDIETLAEAEADLALMLDLVAL